MIKRIKADILLETYENIRETNRQNASILAERHFILKKGGSDYLEVINWNEGKDWMFVLDNFPFPRKRFRTDIPICSIEDFESDLKRMGIAVPARKIKEQQ